MWIETDHHGIVNLRYIKRIDLAGDMEKGTLGVYLFDVDGNTFPIVDLPRFKNIGILKGSETDKEVQVAVYTFYSVAKKLIAEAKDRHAITIETIYKEFASEWYSHQKREISRADQKTKPKKHDRAGEPLQPPSGQENGSGKIHNFSDMKQFLDAYTEIFNSKFHRKPPIQYRNEGRIARDLVKLYPLEKLRTLLHWYFESDEDFVTKAQYDMKTFKAILERTRKAEASEEK
jgi:hypothetical protein